MFIARNNPETTVCGANKWPVFVGAWVALTLAVECEYGITDSTHILPSRKILLGEGSKHRVRYFAVTLVITTQHSMWRRVQRHKMAAQFHRYGNDNLLACTNQFK